ncbi:hypothetical protein BH18ACI2_BH18ACI2_15460 [soil metagenome]
MILKTCRACLFLLGVALCCGVVTQTSAKARRPTGDQRSARVTAQARARTVAEQTGSRRTVSAERFAGANICAKINAAGAALGAQAGTIIAPNGGGQCGETAIRVAANHKLVLGKGVYSFKTRGVPLLLDSDTTLEGRGWETIIEESSVPRQFTAIQNYANKVSNGATSRNIHIRNLQVKGAQPPGVYDSTDQTVSLGNCHNCSVENVFFNETNAIGLQFGASSTLGSDPGPDLQARGITQALGRYADQVTVRNCLFYRVASQNLALVNGQNVVFEKNTFKDPYQNEAGVAGPYVQILDLECNEANDRLFNVVIAGNTLDATNSLGNSTGYSINGIAVNATAGTGRNILVKNNTLIGGPLKTDAQGTPGAKMLWGIVVAAGGGSIRDVTVTGNVMQKLGAPALALYGAKNIEIHDNLAVSTATSGFSAIYIEGSTNNKIYRNVLRKDPQTTCSCSVEITEVDGSDRNTYWENTGGRPTLAGKASKIISHTAP